MAWLKSFCVCACFSLSASVILDLKTYPLKAKIPPEISIVISKAVATKASEAYVTKNTHVNSACPECNGKEYSEPCPASWAENQDGTCQAPVAYHGACAPHQTFVGASALDKQEAELACDVCWPCPEEPGCARDWSWPCPYGYTAEPIEFNAYVDASGPPTCIANLDYQGDCEDLVRFDGDGDKQQFATRCSVRWPCTSACENHVQSVCPYGWTHIGNMICAAPAHYKEDGCNLLQSFHGWSAEMKTDYSRRCHVVWPCQETDEGYGSVRMSKCEELNLGSCPHEWTPTPDGVCHPPAVATGPCTEAKQLGTLTKTEMLSWAGSCLLSWPCKDIVQSAEAETAGSRTPWNSVDLVDGPLREAFTD